MYQTRFYVKNKQKKQQKTETSISISHLFQDKFIRVYITPEIRLLTQFSIID